MLLLPSVEGAGAAEPRDDGDGCILVALEGRDAALAGVWVEPPANVARSATVHDLSARLRAFERADPLAYGGDSARGSRVVRRAIYPRLQKSPVRV